MMPLLIAYDQSNKEVINLNYQAHQIGGVCTGITAGLLIMHSQGPGEVIIATGILTVASWAGSLFPDIDHRSSKIGRSLKSVSYIINKTAGHRGALHSPFFYLVFAGISCLMLAYFNVSMIYTWILFGFLLGCYCHLTFDLMTIEGVPLFWPVNKKKYHIMKLYTGRDDWKGCLIYVIICILVCLFQIQIIS